MSDAIHVLSLGAGVQSTTVLLMAERGEIERPIEAVFADTGWEPQRVYAHLAWLEQHVTIPITRISAGDLRADALAGKPAAWMPLYIRNVDGERAMLRRQCTTNYKIRPIRRRVREVMEAHGAKRIVQQFGISIDEFQRMRTSDVKYITNSYPLVDRRMTRGDCVAWLERHGYPVPGKSSCLGCPYHDRGHWREMQVDDPSGFADAVAFDRDLREHQVAKAPAFLHASMQPLDEVDFRPLAQQRGQLSFDDECEGMCGV